MVKASHSAVRFRAPAGEYALPVEHVNEVRSSADLTALPEPRAGVAGLMRRGDDAITVLSVLGEPGDHVIVMEDDGLTFGTNADAGVCIHFREKVPSPLRRKGHSALTVTVEDVEGLTMALTGCRTLGDISPSLVRHGARES